MIMRKLICLILLLPSISLAGVWRPVISNDVVSRQYAVTESNRVQAYDDYYLYTVFPSLRDYVSKNTIRNTRTSSTTNTGGDTVPAYTPVMEGVWLRGNTADNGKNILGDISANFPSVVTSLSGVDATISFLWRPGFSFGDIGADVKIVETGDFIVKYDDVAGAITATDGTSTSTAPLSCVADTEYLVEVKFDTTGRMTVGYDDGFGYFIDYDADLTLGTNLTFMASNATQWISDLYILKTVSYVGDTVFYDGDDVYLGADRVYIGAEALTW